MSAERINGQNWDPLSPMDYFTYGNVHEWTISGSGLHPFHLHVYHMQTIEGSGGAYDVGEFYDTLSASSGCVVRFRKANFGGRVVLHCHVLGHEDNGAMIWVDMQGGPTPDITDVDPFQCTTTTCIPDGSCQALYECGSSEGRNNCDDVCKVRPDPSCLTGEECLENQCVGPTQCQSAKESCQFEQCCSGLSCSNGKPSSRVCS